MNRGIWVIAGHKDGKLLDVSLEVISELKRVADQINEEVSAVVIGSQIPGMLDTLAQHGAGKVLMIEDENFEPYSLHQYSGQLIELINKYNPRLVAAGATFSVKDYFPSVAVKLGAALITNCAVFTPEEGGFLKFSKPMFGGKVYANISAKKSSLIMATVKPGTFSKTIFDANKSAEIIKVEPAKPDKPDPIKWLGHIESDPETVDVSEAEVILSGGRGVGSKDNFIRLEELAGMIGAAVGGTRPAVDNGWTVFDRQVGQSGKTVTPKIYIACGISGASYHVMGMKDSKVVIAIDKDDRAPMLNLADFGVIADVNEIIPEMIRILGKNNSPKTSET